MNTYTKVVPEHIIIVQDSYGRPYQHTFSEAEYIYVPTLAKVHNWLFSDWGPFVITWRDGMLCPFADDVGNKNITCSVGRRVSLCGLLIEERHINHLPQTKQKKLINKVLCYPWAHRLSNAYWDIPISELLDLPDDPTLVTFHILTRVIKATGWFDWLTEKRKRKHLRSYQYRLKVPLPLRP